MRKKSRQVSQQKSLLFCDLTQSWSEQGGGVRTYLLRKRDYILQNTPHRHLLIVPGTEDAVIEQGRLIMVTIRSPRVPGSPNYRLLLRNGAVRSALDRFRPDLIECEDAYNLPWAALAYRRDHPAAVVTAAYMTDFPTAYVERPIAKVLGDRLARGAAKAAYSYCRRLYRKFDRVFALGEHGGARTLRDLGVEKVAVLGLGADLAHFGPQYRDPALRERLGLRGDQPLIIYAGRLDKEKRPDIVVDAFRKLPPELGAQLVLIGDGPLRSQIAALGNVRIHLPGFVTDCAQLARWLASADLYASAMAFETFGVSILEAQASGLPVVGVAAGAMLDRVDPATGRLGPVDNSDAMAANMLDLWNSDRRAVGKAAQQRASGHSWETVMSRLFNEHYAELLDGRRSLSTNGCLQM